MKKRIRRILLVVVATLAMASFGLYGCASQPAEEKDIPDGMSEAAYDMGMEIYDLSGDCISGADGYDTTSAAIQSAFEEYASNIDTESSKPDERVVMMSSLVYMEFYAGEESEYSKGNVESYRDGLGYTLGTGEYSDDFAAMETE